MLRETKRLIRDPEMVLSPTRSYRPTDNPRQERGYRTVKQEEIYSYPTYPTETSGSIMKRDRIRLYEITPPGLCTTWATAQNSWSTMEEWSELSKNREPFSIVWPMYINLWPSQTNTFFS